MMLLLATAFSHFHLISLACSQLWATVSFEKNCYRIPGQGNWDRKVKTRPSSVGNLQLVTNKKSLSQPRTAKQMVKKTKTSLTRASCQMLLMNSGRRKRGPWKWVCTKTIRKGILRPKDRRAYSTSDPHPTGSSDWLYLSQTHRFACFASLIKAHGFIALLHWLFTAQSRSLE